MVVDWCLIDQRNAVELFAVLEQSVLEVEIDSHEELTAIWFDHLPCQFLMSLQSNQCSFLQVSPHLAYRSADGFDFVVHSNEAIVLLVPWPQIDH